jgi:hypothetical protein
LISTKGTSVYSTPVGFFDPQDITFDFTATSQSPFFDLTITDATTPSGTGGFLPAVQFGLSASGATFTAGGEYFVDLSKGGESEVATESFSGTIQVDPANSNLLLLTGTWTDTPVITSLPSNAMCGSAVNFDSVFSLTKEGPSEVPEPSGGALWLGIIIPSLLLLRPWWSRL